MKLLSVDNFIAFECIGGDCPISCCGGKWGIDIDNETMKYYLSVEGEFGARLRENIIRLNGKNAFRLDEETKDCVFLNENKLCSIYRELGPDALCETCRTYPRVMYDVGDITFCFLTNSCPEVNRMIMQRTDKLRILFDDSSYEEEEFERMDWYRFNSAIKALSTGMNIIQNRSISLRDRLLYLLLFVSKFQELSKENRDTTDIIAAFSEPALYMKLKQEDWSSGRDYTGRIHAFTLSFRSMIFDAYNHPMWSRCIQLAKAISNNELYDVEQLKTAFMTTETEQIQNEFEQLMAYRFFAVFMQGYEKNNYLEKLAYEYVMLAALDTYIALTEITQEEGCSQEDRILFASLFGRIEHADKRKDEFIESIKKDGFYRVETLFKLIV